MKSKSFIRWPKTSFWLFLFVFFVYYWVGTKGLGQAPLDLDHFNPLAKAFLHGRLDIPEPATTYDLTFYQGRWYPYWGPLPSLLLMPVQLVMGRFIPLFYLNLFFGSLNVAVIYWLLNCLRKEFLPQFSQAAVILTTLLFAFGTTHFYLATNAGVWHVAQIVSFFPTSLGLYLIFKKKRSQGDYLLSSALISLAFLGRLSMIALLVIPFWLGWQEAKKRKAILTMLSAPVIFFFSLFCWYNWIRFGSPLESGYSHVVFHPHFLPLIEKYGIYSIRHLPRNLWFMTLEIPQLTWRNGPQLIFNLNGNSIFFFTPPLLTIFLAGRDDRYSQALWLGLLAAMLPSLLIYSTGWIQFGYRYSLDFMAPLLLLSVFGIKGRLNILYFLGTIFAIWMSYLGITALQ